MYHDPVESPPLSVIVCTYNRASYLPACLGSLRAAGVPGLEIVVVDDGSTDDTKAVVEKLNGPDVRYVYQTNKGLSTARNTGIAAARGRYVAYLDSDDLWLAGVAPKLIDFLDRHPEVGVAFTEAKVGNDAEGFTPWTEWAGRDEFKQLPHAIVDGFRVFDRTAFHRQLIRRNLVFTGAVFQRREVLAEAGGFNPKLNAAGDWELYLRIAARHVFAFCPDPLAIYIQHPAQMTTGWDKMALEFCDTRRAHLASGVPLGADEVSLLKQTLRGELFYYAYLAYDRRDYREANRRFAQLLRECGMDKKALAYWGLTCLPRPMTQGVRSLRALFVRDDGVRVGPQPWAPAARAGRNADQ
ncbi:glycosyltransferase family 2 protein [Limnoglobus roseus]|uniref:glycosyltransferase family 2 protein n=1 Tax=Limnoglobus roseus TaxID=2598579 RepID=UPI00143DAF0B|nr:glycosyltransferase family 2 protein [Limnoglobus roseus]